MFRAVLIGLATLLGALPCFAADEDKYTTVKGRFIWDAAKGAAPARVVIKPTKDEEVCAKDKDFKTEEFVISPKGGIKNVVVWLAPEPEGRRRHKVKELAAVRPERHPSEDGQSRPKRDSRSINRAAGLSHTFRPRCKVRGWSSRTAPQSRTMPSGRPMTTITFNPLIPAGAQFKHPHPARRRTLIRSPSIAAFIPG